jgi:hypothetical protein
MEKSERNKRREKGDPEIPAKDRDNRLESNGDQK